MTDQQAAAEMSRCPCITATHCQHFGRCLAECAPSELPHVGQAAAVRRVVEHLHWIRGFCIAHHAQERSGVHLHRLAVDLPQYLDGAIAELEVALGEAPTTPCGLVSVERRTG